MGQSGCHFIVLVDHMYVKGLKKTGITVTTQIFLTITSKAYVSELTYLTAL